MCDELLSRCNFRQLCRKVCEHVGTRHIPLVTAVITTNPTSTNYVHNRLLHVLFLLPTLGEDMRCFPSLTASATQVYGSSGAVGETHTPPPTTTTTTFGTYLTQCCETVTDHVVLTILGRNERQSACQSAHSLIDTCAVLYCWCAGVRVWTPTTPRRGSK